MSNSGSEDIAAMEGEGQCNPKTLATRKRMMDSFINFGITQDDSVDVLELIKKAEDARDALLRMLPDSIKQFLGIKYDSKNNSPAAQAGEVGIGSNDVPFQVPNQKIEMGLNDVPLNVPLNRVDVGSNGVPQITPMQTQTNVTNNVTVKMPEGMDLKEQIRQIQDFRTDYVFCI